MKFRFINIWKYAMGGVIEIPIACINLSFNRYVFNLHFQTLGVGFSLTVFLLPKK